VTGAGETAGLVGISGGVLGELADGGDSGVAGAGIAGTPEVAVGTTEGFGDVPAGVGAGAGADGGVGFVVNVADVPLKLFSNSVPNPSPERTEPFVMVMMDVPVIFGTKVMVASTRDAPLKPGLGVPPVKVMVPAVFE